MLNSIPPFITTDETMIYENIKKAPLVLEDFISPACKDLLSKLLHKNPYSRLGAREGVKEIMDHPWFASIDWDDLYKKRIQPKIYKIKEPRNRRNEIKMGSMVDLPNQPPVRFRDQQMVKVPNWSFYNDSDSE
jgi:serine/threonine protein kinase